MKSESYKRKVDTLN